MDPCTSDTHEHSKIPRGPARTCRDKPSNQRSTDRETKTERQRQRDRERERVCCVCVANLWRDSRHNTCSPLLGACWPRSAGVSRVPYCRLSPPSLSLSPSLSPLALAPLTRKNNRATSVGTRFKGEIRQLPIPIYARSPREGCQVAVPVRRRERGRG